MIPILRDGGESLRSSEEGTIPDKPVSPASRSAPGRSGAGEECLALVELVDVYPTVVELCGLPEPAGVEGRSLVPLLDDPEKEWAESALSQFPRARTGNRHSGHGAMMGYALRTERYRYVEWRDLELGGVEAVELYDHENDPREMRNVAKLGRNRETIDRLARVLSAGWKKSLPERAR